VRARCREWNCDDCCEEGEVSGLHQIDWGFFAGTMSGFATEVAAADGSLAEEVGGENARDVIATAAPLRPPTNKTHAVTSTTTVRSVCLTKSGVGAVLWMVLI
jgi:hypothetical protein